MEKSKGINPTIVLIGKTGQGKSSLGNKISNSAGAFKVGEKLKNETTKISKTDFKWPYNQNLTVSLLDTPGFADNSRNEGLSDEEIMKMIFEYMENFKGGFNVALFCWEAKSRFDKNDIEEFFILYDLLQKEVFNHVWLCVTQFDKLVPDDKERARKNAQNIPQILEKNGICLPENNILFSDFDNFDGLMKPLDKILRESPIYNLYNLHNPTIVLIGKTGQGKSSLGNKISNNAGTFKVGRSIHSETKEISKKIFKWPKNPNLTVTLIDTPGLADNTRNEGLSDEEIMKMIENYMETLKNGFNVALFCWEAKSRFDKNDINEFYILSELLEKKKFNHVWLCATQLNKLVPDEKKKARERAQDIPKILEENLIYLPENNILFSDFDNFDGLMEPLDEILKESSIYFPQTIQDPQTIYAHNMMKLLRQEQEDLQESLKQPNLHHLKVQMMKAELESVSKEVKKMESIINKRLN